MAIVPWSDDVKSAFLQMQFEAQTRHYDTSFPKAEFSIVEIDGERGGRLYLDRREDEIRIVDIALLPEFRGRGIGSELLRSVLLEAEQREMAVRIHVEHNNPALRLYERLNFSHVDSNGVYHLMEWTPR
jgi:ribosomal protein S18 acetylase RimI-like enzyme